MDKRIILFELNEVPLRIIDEFCRWHPESALARRLPECHQYETYAEDLGHLSPWKTWPTVHRGISNDKHLISDFGQDLTEQNKEFPPVWEILRNNAVNAGVCGSLHTYPPPSDYEGYSFFLPDTFAAGAECFPKDLELFQKFNLSMARDSARNVSSKLAWVDALAMLRASGELGLRLRTYAEVGRQLVDERLQSWKKNRRRTFQAVLAFDIFMRQLEQHRPQFATFFTNHVASSQHRFWAAAFPKDYEHFGYDQKWVNTYCHEIQFAMQKFNDFFARLINFVDENREYVLWVTTSMGQAATETRSLETELFLVEPAKFAAVVGLEPSDWEPRPAMLPQWNVLVRPHKVSAFRDSISKLFIDGSPLSFREAQDGFFSLDFGQANISEKADTVTVNGTSMPLADLGLKNIEIEDKSGANAYHIPQGSLLVYDAGNRSRSAHRHRPQVSTKELAPTILQNYSVPVPEYMAKPVRIGA